MKNKILWLLIGILLVGGIFLTKNAPRKATITFDVPNNVSINKDVTIPIFIDTRGETINAGEFYLDYDPSEIEVKSVGKDPSFFQLWVPDSPSFSQDKGEIAFAGGLPTPGFSGRAQVGTVTLRALKTKTIELTFANKTRILKNDGKGTLIPLRLSPVLIHVAS